MRSRGWGTGHAFDSSMHVAGSKTVLGRQKKRFVGIHAPPLSSFIFSSHVFWLGASVYTSHILAWQATTTTSLRPPPTTNRDQKQTLLPPPPPPPSPSPTTPHTALGPPYLRDEPGLIGLRPIPVTTPQNRHSATTTATITNHTTEPSDNSPPREVISTGYIG